MACTGPHKKQPGRGKYGAVQRAKCGAGHKHRHQERGKTEHFVSESDRNRVWSEQIIPAEHHKVSHIGHHVNNCHDRHWYANGSWQVPREIINNIHHEFETTLQPYKPVGIFQFFRNIVQVVPSGIREQTTVEGEGYMGRIPVGAVHWCVEIIRMSSEQMNESSYDDDDKGEYFCSRKRVRYSGNPSEKKIIYAIS